MKQFVIVEKKSGETPLQALEAYRASDPELKEVPMTYAGRLDPMAEGQLLILIGDECKNKEAYLGLDKEYEFEVLFNISTDTGDILGIPSYAPSAPVLETRIEEAEISLLGEHTLPYPAYSSKTVGGRQLFDYAAKSELEEIEVPARTMIVKDIFYENMRTVTKEALVEEVMRRISAFNPPVSSLPNSDFRKEEIIRRWQELQKTLPEILQIAKFKAVVSAGTYIRALSEVLARRLETTGLAYSIKRTRIFLDKS